MLAKCCSSVLVLYFLGLLHSTIFQVVGAVEDKVNAKETKSKENKVAKLEIVAVHIGDVQDMAKLVAEVERQRSFDLLAFLGRPNSTKEKTLSTLRDMLKEKYPNTYYSPDLYSILVSKSKMEEARIGRVIVSNGRQIYVDADATEKSGPREKALAKLAAFNMFLAGVNCDPDYLMFRFDKDKKLIISHPNYLKDMMSNNVETNITIDGQKAFMRGSTMEVPKPSKCLKKPLGIVKTSIQDHFWLVLCICMAIIIALALVIIIQCRRPKQ